MNQTGRALHINRLGNRLKFLVLYDPVPNQLFLNILIYITFSRTLVNNLTNLKKYRFDCDFCSFVFTYDYVSKKYNATKFWGVRQGIQYSYYTLQSIAKSL